MNKFAQNINDKVSHLFRNFALVPSLSEDERHIFTFLAQPREGDSIEKIRNTLEHLKSGLEVENSAFIKNGHQFTLGEIKVNIIYVSTKDEFDFCFDVSSYGINLILGKIIKRMGLKLTHNCLLYEEKLGVENHQSKVGEFVITTDPRKLFNLLQLDYERFKAGFSSKEDIFAFIATCPYLKQQVFTEPKKEHKMRIHQEFQAYLILNPITEPYKKITFQEIDSFFDDVDFIAGVERLKEKERRKREAVEKFNGRVILSHFPDFDRKKIGTSMGYFKYSFKDVEQYRDFLAENSIEAVMNKFKEVVNF
jgi:hypothetical protein